MNRDRRTPEGAEGRKTGGERYEDSVGGGREGEVRFLGKAEKSCDGERQSPSRRVVF
jgi:hypothetical protein